MNINITLITQMIAFGVFVVFCMRYVWPPITKALDERTAKIAEGLAAAERGQQEQELGEQRALEVMREAKGNASDIITQAQKRYNDILDEAKRDAQAEAERIKTAAHAEIEQKPIGRAKNCASAWPRWPSPLPRKFCKRNQRGRPQGNRQIVRRTDLRQANGRRQHNNRAALRRGRL